MKTEISIHPDGTMILSTSLLTDLPARQEIAQAITGEIQGEGYSRVYVFSLEDRAYQVTMKLQGGGSVDRALEEFSNAVHAVSRIFDEWEALYRRVRILFHLHGKEEEK